MPARKAEGRWPVLSVCLGGFPGTDRALRELAAATGLTRHVTIADTDSTGPALRFVESLATDPETRLLVVGGWADAYDALVETAAARGIRVAVYWTSSGGQSEMGRERDRLERVLADPRLHARWFIHAPLAASVERTCHGVAVMPHLLPRGLSPRARVPRRRGAPLKVGLFCSPHEYHRKNVLNSLLAVAQLGDRAQLHLNGVSQPGGYLAWLERLGIDYVEHGWMDDATYGDAVRGLDVALQASFAESFNYVAAEHLLCGVPVVGSPMVPVIAMLPARLRRALTVDNPDDPLALADRIRALAGRRGRVLASDAAAFLRRQRRGQVAEATRLIRHTLGAARARGTSKGTT